MPRRREHVANIDERGARRRRIGGYAWAVVSVIALGVMLAICAPRALRLALFVPLFLSALGFQQARERT